MSIIAAIVGRLLLALLFVLAGLGKLMDPAGTAEYIASTTRLPGTLAMPIGLFELIAGIFLALGFMTRLTALLLAGFTLLTVVFFHNQFGDQMQQTLALKNIAIVGGLLVVFAHGHMRGTFDHERNKAQDAMQAEEPDKTRDD